MNKPFLPLEKCREPLQAALITWALITVVNNDSSTGFSNAALSALATGISRITRPVFDRIFNVRNSSDSTFIQYMVRTVTALALSNAICSKIWAGCPTSTIRSTAILVCLVIISRFVFHHAWGTEEFPFDTDVVLAL